MSNDRVDVALVGAGIMSTTLGVFLKELKPDLRLEMIERLPGEAQESSGAWNNAGTGHAANCELNYTPMRADGSIDIAKALEVNVEFDLSRQLWSYLGERHLAALRQARGRRPSYRQGLGMAAARSPPMPVPHSTHASSRASAGSCSGPMPASPPSS